MWRARGALTISSKDIRSNQRALFQRPFHHRHLAQTIWRSEHLVPDNDQRFEGGHFRTLDIDSSNNRISNVSSVCLQNVDHQGSPQLSERTLVVEATETKRTEFSTEPSSPGPENDKDDDYYANMGDALRTLRDDIPHIFKKDLNYEIYRDDIVFKDSRLEFKGIKNYKIICWSLRFHGNLFFKHMHVDIMRIWQPEDYIIKMRWQVNGYPRVWWEAEGRIDGISTYKLDRQGKIYEHSIDNVQLRDPPITNPLLYGMNWVFYPSNHPQSIPMPGS